MTDDARARYDEALRPARVAAYPPGQYVGQESFMRAGDILALARRAGIGPGSSVVDLCCGVAGPGRLITSELGCSYLGVDSSAAAVDLARSRTNGLACRFEVAAVPPVPSGPFDVVLLLETMLAFAEKRSLLREVSAALVPGGRFAFTVEEGRPLDMLEQEAMPAADTVWPIRLEDLTGLLVDVGMEVRRIRECTRSHRSIADAVIGAVLAERSAIVAQIGRSAVDDLLAAHRLWRDWMTSGRVRKFAIVAEKPGARSSN